MNCLFVFLSHLHNGLLLLEKVNSFASICLAYIGFVKILRAKKRTASAIGNHFQAFQCVPTLTEWR